MAQLNWHDRKKLKGMPSVHQAARLHDQGPKFSVFMKRPRTQFSGLPSEVELEPYRVRNPIRKLVEMHRGWWLNKGWPSSIRMTVRTPKGAFAFCFCKVGARPFSRDHDQK